MNALHESLPFVERMGWTLVHSIWQFAALAILTWLVLIALRTRSATVRYSFLLVMLAVMVVGPVLTWCGFKGTSATNRIEVAGPVSPAGSIASSGGLETRSAAAPISNRAVSPAAGTARQAPVPVTATSLNTRQASQSVSELGWKQWGRNAIRPWLSVLCRGWLIGTLLFAVRPILGWCYLSRLRRRQVLPVPSFIRDSLCELMTRTGMKQSVRIVSSALAAVPMVVGYWRPVILLPVSVVSGLPISQLEPILAHELAHIRRHDYLVNVMQTVVETVFFYHPAVWWLNHRIRIERENCCDDYAISVTCDRVVYSRMLLALADLRAAPPALAVSSNGGRLIQRVRRLLAMPPERDQRGGDGLVGAVASLLVLVASSWVVGQVEHRPPEVEPVPSHGLLCRLVAVDPATKLDQIAQAEPVSEYTHPRDVTFAVELLNVSDEPVKLRGVAYGEGYRQSAGKPNPNHFGPHFFDFEFTTSAGKPIPRAKRAFTVDTQSAIVNGVSIHELAPGESLRVLLRPTHFERSMSYRLGGGDFRVKVRYHGISSEVQAAIDERSTDRVRDDLWNHEVVSNETQFKIKPQPQPKLVWGAPTDGLRAAMEITVPPGSGDPLTAPGVLVGTNLNVVFHVQNVGDQDVTFVSEAPRQGDSVEVVDEAGKPIKVRNVWFSGWPIDVRWVLKPGDVAQLPLLTPSLNDLDRPGRYTVNYTIRFNSRILKDDAGNQIFPAPGDWQSTLQTGPTTLVLRTKPQTVSAQGEIHGYLVDDETGEPVRGATVACGAVINDSRRGGGDNSVTDSAGFYRLKPPSPGIYNVWLKKHPRSQRITAAADDGILVQAGQISTSQLRVLDGRYVSGTVIDPTGTLVPNIVVSCYSAARPQTGGVQSVRTDRDGKFAFYLPPGRAYVYSYDRNEAAADANLAVHRHTGQVLDVPRSAQITPLTLKLSTQPTRFGANDWLAKSTPGTEIVSHTNRDDVTGLVVDASGQPVAAAQVFKSGGPVFESDAQGRFRVRIERGTQFVLHAFKPGFHVWLGTPTAGDELKVVLESKQRD